MYLYLFVSNTVVVVFFLFSEIVSKMIDWLIRNQNRTQFLVIDSVCWWWPWWVWVQKETRELSGCLSLLVYMLHVVGVSTSTTPFFPQPPPPSLQRRHGNRHSLLLSAGLESSARPPNWFFCHRAVRRWINYGGRGSLADWRARAEALFVWVKSSRPPPPPPSPTHRNQEAADQEPL